MKRILFRLFVLFAISSQVARGAETPPLIDRPNAASGPTQVSTEIWVVDIISVDSARETFTGDIAVVLRWKDPRLAHTTAGLAHYGLDQIWHPRVVIVNETNTVTRRLPESVEVTSDGTVVYRQRYVGPFTQPLHMQSFLFDKQTFRIHFIAVRYTPNEVNFVPDQDWIDAGLRQAGGISPSITLPDWTIKEWDIKSLVYTLPPGIEYSGYVFRVHRFAQRAALHSEGNSPPLF
jgi:Neurotransmitter-gated ion-channel ligand binding domain